MLCWGWYSLSWIWKLNLKQSLKRNVLPLCRWRQKVCRTHQTSSCISPPADFSPLLTVSVRLFSYIVYLFSCDCRISRLHHCQRGRRKLQPHWSLSPDATSMLIICRHAHCHAYALCFLTILPQPHIYNEHNYLCSLPEILAAQHHAPSLSSLLCKPRLLQQLIGCQRAVTGSRLRSRADCRALWLILFCYRGDFTRNNGTSFVLISHSRISILSCSRKSVKCFQGKLWHWKCCWYDTEQKVGFF